MSKKILSVMLAIVFVLSTFVVSAFAATPTYEVPNEETEVIEYTQTWGLSEAVENADGTYSVDVTLQTNYLVGAISFELTETAGAVLTDVITDDLALSYAANVDFIDHGDTSLVTIIPVAANDAEEGADLSAGDAIATLVYTLDAVDTATVTLVNDAKCLDNGGGDLVAVRMSDNTLTTGTMLYGQLIVDADGNEIALGETIDEVTMGAPAMLPADLALKATAAAGIIIDTHKTFGGAYAGVVYGFTGTAFMNTSYITNNLEATNGGTLTFARSIGKTGYGTGTTITVKNADGTDTGKVYVVVIFGDADANGLLNANDTTAIKGAVANASKAPNNSVVRMAANAQSIKNAAMLHTLNANDTTAMKRHVANTAKINQATLASYQNSFNNFYQ